MKQIGGALNSGNNIIEFMLEKYKTEYNNIAYDY